MQTFPNKEDCVTPEVSIPSRVSDSNANKHPKGFPSARRGQQACVDLLGLSEPYIPPMGACTAHPTEC